MTQITMKALMITVVLLLVSIWATFFADAEVIAQWFR